MPTGHQSCNTENSPRITVVIVNFNSGDCLANCLDALLRQTYRNFNVIVADNNSADESLPAAMERFVDPRLKFIKNDMNLGFAVANNQAIEETSSEWIATLNPDTVPHPSWLETMMDATETHQGVAMLGATLINLEQSNILDGAGDNYFALGIAWRGGHGKPLPALPQYTDVFAPCAAAALYRRDVFINVGGFASTFFCYMEDVDIAFRFRLSGYRCIHVGNAKVAHVGGAITKNYSGFQEYYGSRNRIWTFLRNMPSWLFWILLPGHVAVNIAFLFLAMSRGTFRPVFRGILDAIKGIPGEWKSRREIQKTRSITPLEIAKYLCWSPMRLVRRSILLKPADKRALAPRTKTLR